ncbi:965_t:CDS:1, partial [Entrophospora sp. SA101]
RNGYKNGYSKHPDLLERKQQNIYHYQQTSIEDVTGHKKRTPKDIDEAIYD